MSQDYTDQIDSLMMQASDLPHGPTEIALIEEAISIADAHNDVHLGFATRHELIQAATFGGRPDLALVAFSWSLTQSDRDPEQFPEGDLLWQYKWIVDNLPNFPSISRAQIDELFTDMTERFQRNGSTLHAVYQIRRDVAFDMCDTELANEYDAIFRKTKRDYLSNCAACVQNSSIRFQIYLGDDEAAIEASRPIIEGGMACGTVPQNSYALLVLPLLRLGKVKRAISHFKTGYGMIRSEADYIDAKGLYIAFLALTNNLDRANRLFIRHIKEALESPRGVARFNFLAASRLFLDQLTARPTSKVMFRLPKGIDHPLGDEPTSAQARNWINDILIDLAGQFNKRNGNDGYTKKLGWWHNQPSECGGDYPITS